MAKKVIKQKPQNKLMETKILEKLNAIQENLEYIKEHMVDADTILTLEEKKLLNESITHEKAKKLTPLEAIKHVRDHTR